MEKKLISYETLYVISGNLSEEEMKEIVAKFSTLVSDNGELESVNEWGKRRLAYPINYIPEGYYVLVSYKSEPSFPREFERVLGITDGIIRSMTTKKIEGAPASAVPAPAVVAEEAVEAEAKTEEAPAVAETPVAEEAPAAEATEPAASEDKAE
ncbi:MAG: 30S ribosomal protein S6 [Clostridia bacterium]|nr:30S ribosomal protein S6 [Clostridia bacterium]